MQKPNRSSYSAMELLDWANSKSLLLTPKFQRRGVWQPAARSFFIDTMLRGMPVPPVYVRLTQSEKKDKVIREVIDGQQRISAVTAYMRDEYSLSNSLTGTWRGKKFSQLTPIEQNEIRNYSFNAESFQGIADAEVLEIFSRLNTYSVPLNSQELRNGKYFGHFKQVVYSLSYEHLEFWRSNKLFTERGIARMEEAELVSELLAASLEGLQNGKKSLDNFYGKYDEVLLVKDELIKKFRSTISDISESLGNLTDTEFHRLPLFYTLYCAIYHYRYGLPSCELERGSKPDAQLSAKTRQRLSQAVLSLSDALVSAKDGGVVEESIEPFIAATTRHTDDLKPRLARIEILYKRAFL
jgi:uncharacterized protein with ParB-like and HNH nuclease domain